MARLPSSTMMNVNRRELLQWGTGLAAVAAGGALSDGRQAVAESELPTTQPARSQRPKNVIFMVSDGMSMGVPTLAEPFSRLVRAGKGTLWYKLLQDPDLAHGYLEMASLNSLVTDSAAASSSWGSGVRVFNGSINVLPDGTRLKPLAPLAHSAGRRVGLVTTTTITHATPAGFAAVQPNRDDEDKIAPQYRDLVDVLMGGGTEFFPEALLQQYRGSGYTLWQERREVLAADRPSKVLGLFYKGHLPYTLDRNYETALQEKVPTLAEMTRKALDILSDSPQGFLLQVEGGRVDHAAHANDAAGILWEQLAFDDAVAVAVEYARQRGDTLVVLTSDHGNSNPGLNGMGDGYEKSVPCFERLAGVTASHKTLLKLLGYKDDKPVETQPGQVHEVIRMLTGIEIMALEAISLTDALAHRSMPQPNRQLANPVGMLGAVLSNYTGIGWTGTTHTADLVMVTALGPGQEAFRGLHRNTEVFNTLTGYMGVRHKNPTASPEMVKKSAMVAGSHRPHWA